MADGATPINPTTRVWVVPRAVENQTTLQVISLGLKVKAIQGRQTCPKAEGVQVVRVLDLKISATVGLHVVGALCLLQIDLSP